METPESEHGLRPRLLREYMGQYRIQAHLKVAIAAAQQRNEPLDHVLIQGDAGGKRTLAYIIGNEMGAEMHPVSVTGFPKVGDLFGILANLKAKDILFIDDMQALPREVDEMLCGALENFEADIVLGAGATARTVRYAIERFTLVAVTARPESLSRKLRAQFGIVLRMEPYTLMDIATIVRWLAKALALPIDDAAAIEIAEHSRGTPRVAQSLLRRTRDFADVLGNGNITRDVVLRAFEVIDIDEVAHQKQTGTPREPISDDVRMFVWQRDQGSCVKCGNRERIEFDHIIPLARGGSNTARNLQLLCESCNRQKGVAI